MRRTPACETPDLARDRPLRRPVGSHAQHRLDALTLQLAPSQRRRRALLKPSYTRFERIELEEHTLDPLQAPLAAVHARADAFDEGVQHSSRLARHVGQRSPAQRQRARELLGGKGPSAPER
jgi:hypothetical protein